MAKRKSSEEKRARIRHAAYVCFREGGYHQTSIDDICEAADISKGSFYWHYGAKIDVFVDILDVWAREVVDELLRQFEEASRSPQRITLLQRAFEKEFHRARVIVPMWTEFSLHARHDREIQITLAKFFRRARAAIAEILRQVAGGSLSEEQIRASAAMILGAYTGVVMQDLADPSHSAETWAKAFMSVLDMLLGNISNANSISLDSPQQGSRLAASRIDEYIEAASPEVQSCFQRLRRAILKIAPQADEKMIRGWGVVAYNSNGIVCHLKLLDATVELAFYRGDKIDDPSGITTKKGRKRRVVEVSKAPSVALKGLLKQAFSMVESR